MTEGWRGDTGKRSLGMACGDVVLKLSKSQLSNSYKHASIYEPREAASGMWQGERKERSKKRSRRKQVQSLPRRMHVKVH